MVVLTDRVAPVTDSPYIFFELDEVASEGLRTSVWRVKASQHWLENISPWVRAQKGKKIRVTIEVLED